MTINKNFWLLLIFILSGIVIGGLLGELATQVSYLGWLAYGMDFGTTNPFTLDMGLLNLTFGLTFKMNIASIIGLLIAVFIYRKVVR